MPPVRLGAVRYLNARPLVYGLERQSRFTLRYDVPSECAGLLHAGAIDVGLIPSIEYWRGADYRIVPGPAIVSRGPVASVVLYATRPLSDLRSIALDASSRTSIALVRVLCARLFRIQPAFRMCPPELEAMLAQSDAALIIGDQALLVDWRLDSATAPDESRLERAAAPCEDAVVVAAESAAVRRAPAEPTRWTAWRQSGRGGARRLQARVDLGEAWTAWTGLPFVYAFWVGRPGALGAADLEALRQARDEGVLRCEDIARDYFAGSPEHQIGGARYLQDNIHYDLGQEERAGLDVFHRYAAELGLVEPDGRLRFF